MIETGEYIIVNAQTGKALDANVDAATHLSYEHKRPFVWDKTPQAANHKWFVEKLWNGNYILKSRYGNQGELALDGNTNVPQKQHSHPQPFLYAATPSAANHRWILKPVQGGKFLIVNEANGLALDGNVGALQHHDHRYQSPFLWRETPHAANHHWIFEPVSPIQSGRYMIVNKMTGQALDANINAPQQVSHQHKRPFMWAATPSAENHYWTFQHLGADEYMITSNFSGMNVALDGNVSVPQHAHSHPTPYVWHTPTPTAANHRWKIIAVPNEPGSFYIINSQNRLALDGNVSGSSHHDHQHQAPFLWAHTPQALNHKWELRPYGGSNQNSSYSTTTTTTYHQPPQQQHHNVTLDVGGMISSAFNVVNSAMQQQQHQQQQYHHQTPQSVYQVPQQPQHFHQPNVHIQASTNLPYQQPNVYQVPNQPPQHFQQQQHFQQPNVHVHHQPMHIHQQPHVQISTGGAMDHGSFQGFLASLKKESFESGRKNLLSSIAAHNYFTCDQLSQIMKMLSFSSEKVYAASVIVPRIVDKQNSHVVLSSLTFSSDKDEVTKLFARY